MNPGRAARALAAALALSAALAACGGGSSGSGGSKGPSALDPANMVPATVVAYAAVAIRPQRGIGSRLAEAIDSIAGSGSAQRLSAELDRSLGRKWSQMKPWVGQRAGFALTGIPARPADSAAIESDLLVVLPTSDPAAARKYLARTIKDPSEGWNVVGHYAIVGGKNAVGQAEVTTARTSLATDTGFKADMAQLGGGQIFSAYGDLHRLYQQLLPLLRSSPGYQASMLREGAAQAPPGSSIALGGSALHDQFRLDVVERGTLRSSARVTGVATDVSSLPASSWLAITLGGALAKAGTVSRLATSMSRSITTLEAAGGVSGRIPDGSLQFIVKDLLPALGPAELSVSGSSSTTLQAGLVMAPDNRAAGTRLATTVKRMLSGLPVSATTVGGRVVVTFGFSNLQQLLNPSAKLGDNPAFKRALAQLPAGARADIYLNFAGISRLASLDPSPSDSSAMAVLNRLDYLIAGGTHSHFRLVLATH